jgi:hypothetical protein
VTVCDRNSDCGLAIAKGQWLCDRDSGCGLAIAKGQWLCDHDSGCGRVRERAMVV